MAMYMMHQILLKIDTLLDLSLRRAPLIADRRIAGATQLISMATYMMHHILLKIDTMPDLSLRRAPLIADREDSRRHIIATQFISMVRSMMHHEVQRHVSNSL